MDQRFIVIREEHRNVVVQRRIIRHHHVDHVKLIRSDEFPELYLLNLPTHRQEDHYRPSNISTMKDIDTLYGGNNLTMKHGGNKQYSPPHPPHQVQVRQRPSVAAQYSTTMLYTQSPPPPLGNVIDSDEAAKLYNGILIKNFGNNKLPAVWI